MATRTPETGRGGDPGEFRQGPVRNVFYFFNGESMGMEGDGGGTVGPVGAEFRPDGTRQNLHKELKSVELSAVYHQNCPQKYWP